MKPPRADYGLDAPTVLRTMLLCAGIALVAGLGMRWLSGRGLPPSVAISIAISLFCAAASLSVTVVWMYLGSRVLKVRLARRLIDELNLKGSERVLDVGCGHGLMLIAAAKKLSTGKAVGIDLWQRVDQAGNDSEATRANARLEGVADRVELRTGDARQLPFEDNTFDLVLSSWALHNIYDAKGREQAVREIARVLKPGGRAGILDIRHGNEYARVFNELGWQVELGRTSFGFVIPSRWLLARKPESQ